MLASQAQTAQQYRTKKTALQGAELSFHAMIKSSRAPTMASKWLSASSVPVLKWIKNACGGGGAANKDLTTVEL